MNFMPVKLLNITHEEIESMTLYKFMSLSHSINSITNDTLWFSNPKKWKDPWESYFIECAFDKDQKPFEFPIKNRVFACCFSTVGRSENQWRMYSEDNISIMFEIPLKNLIDSLEPLTSKYDVYVAKAAYLPTHVLKNLDVPTILSSANFPTPNDDVEKALLLMSCKRLAFQYESEVRVFLVPKVQDKLDGLEENVALKSITNSYTVSPLIDIELQETIRNIIKLIGKIDKNVYRSTLYNLAIPNVLNW